MIASHYNQPVDPAKIATLVAALIDAEASVPITSDLKRQAELHVADNEYDRKLTVTMGGRQQTIYIGLTTGQTAAVRLGGRPEIYESSRITPWSVAGDPAGWMQKTYAQHAPIAMKAVEVVN
ncbi:MAG: DUF4340 domain-containing protein [Myxococcales bacterium]|nr:DUF4340 domain-containing protein [Myxococcales bacterium]